MKNQSSLFYAEIQYKLIVRLTIRERFAQEQQENGLIAWDISGKIYKKEFFLISMNEKMLWSIKIFF